MSTHDDLVPLFIPSLASLLIGAEDKKESPLTLQDALDVRDQAAVIMVSRHAATQMDEKRGHQDIDPENLWYDWQNLRNALDRKPSIDPGPNLIPARTSDPELLQAAADAQTTIEHFSNLLGKLPKPNAYAMIKTRITEEDKSAQMWLLNPRKHGNNFHAELFEAPAGWTTFKPGDILKVAGQNITDWAINDNGTLQGGYTMRIFRDRKPQAERAQYDEFIGVTTYAPLPKK